MNKTPLRARKSLREITEDKNRKRLADGEPLPELSRSTGLRPRAKKPSRTRREIVPEFLVYVRGQPCAVAGCCNQSQAHHLKSRGAGGSDYTAVPLCGIHHTFEPGVHYLGLTAFEARYNVSLDNLNKILREQYEMADDKAKAGTKKVPNTTLESKKDGDTVRRTAVSNVTGSNARITDRPNLDKK